MQFGPQNIIWGLKNGGWGGPGPPGSATAFYNNLSIWQDFLCASYHFRIAPLISLKLSLIYLMALSMATYDKY